MFVTIGICPLLGVLVLKDVSSKTLDFWGNLEDSAPYLRVTLWFSVSDVIVGGSKVFKKIADYFRARCIVFPVWSCQGYLLFLPGCCTNPLFSGGGLVVFSSLDPLRGRGSEILGRNDSRLQAISQEVFYLTSGFVIMWRRRAQRDILPSLRQDFLCSRISYYYVEEDRIK